MESRRIIEQMADDEPERLAGLVGALLAADDRNEQRGGGRKGRR